VNLCYERILASGKQDSLRILSSDHVTPDSGTGLVHLAPAHGAEDYGIFMARGILKSNDLLCHVNADGAFDSSVGEIVGSEAAKELIGKPVLGDGSKAIVDLLGKEGSLVKVKRFKHKYPYDWKTDQPIIVTYVIPVSRAVYANLTLLHRATSQWFTNLERIGEKALKALRNVRFYPNHSQWYYAMELVNLVLTRFTARNRLEAFISSRSEWCISRQRVWGVPIPSLHHVPSDNAVLTSDSLEHILKVLSEKGVKHWWDGPVEDFLTESLLRETNSTEDEWVKGTDTMDVWFDSGTSWSMLEEQADVCLEGSDQHRGWFQSQLLTSVAVGKDAPYKALITHGMVLDERGKKMSKSLGNIINPLSIVNGGEVCLLPSIVNQRLGANLDLYRTRRRNQLMVLICFVFGLRA
jgi:isoleucyl-tRNA synthetase